MDNQIVVGVIAAGLALGWIVWQHRLLARTRAWLAAQLTARRMRIVVNARPVGDARDTLNEWRRFWQETQRS